MNVGIRTGRKRASTCRLFTATAFVAATVILAGPAGPAFAAPPVATATITAPTVQPLLGEPATLAVTFDNTDLTAAGYAPYVDIRINVAGADGAGAATDDGLTGVTMSFLGANVPALTTGTITCNATGTNVPHPLTGLSVACPIGTRLVVFQLPFGSFTPTQPAAVLATTVTVSNLADVGVPLSVTATPGFAYGATPTGTVPILGTTVTTTVIPQIATLTKTYQGPENETATGPNFPQPYLLTVNLPAAIPFSTVRINDTLPGTHQFNGTLSSSPGATAVSTPSLTVPGGLLSRQWSSVTGAATVSDLAYGYEFHVPLDDASGNPILDQSSGNDVATVNASSMDLTFTPLDIRDSTTSVTVNQDLLDNHTLTAKSIAIQKTSAITTNLGSTGLTPSDTLTYTINGQISDFFSDGNLVVDDLLGDGQTVVAGSATFTATSEGVTAAATFDPVDLTVDVSSRVTCGDGTSAIQFRLSDAISRTGTIPTGGTIVGGLVHTPADTGPGTFRITFRALVSEAYVCLPGDLSIDEGDKVTNNVNVDTELYTPALTPVGATESDTSATSRAVETAPVTKSIYAKNGTIAPVTTAAAADLITYRIRTTSPSSDFENLVITDFVPLPIFDVASFSLAPVTTVCATTPAVNQACYGPTDTLHTFGSAPDPTVSFDTVGNSISFDYGTHDDPASQGAEIDLLFTVEISDAPFRDGLLFTNQVLKLYANSFGDVTTSAGIVQLTLTEPTLDIAKGVASVSNNSIAFVGANRNFTGSTWFNPGVTAINPGFTGTVNSTNVALVAGSPDANVSGADAGDIVRFAIVVENTGSGANGAFDVAIDDNLPAGFAIPAAGVRLQVANGAGTALPHTPGGFFVAAPATTGPQSGTITLTDPSAATGALATRTGNITGTNIAIITYELEVTATALPNIVHTNTTNVTGFSGSDGGPNFIALVPAAAKTNTATVTMALPTHTKAITATDQAHTAAGAVAIGELVTYTVTITVPEGTTPSMTMVDTLPSGLSFKDATAVTMNAAITTGTPVSVASINASVLSPGTTVSIPFGNVDNTNRDNTVTEQIVITYRAVVLDVIGNQNSTALTNSARLNFTGGGAGVTRGASATVVEPDLRTDKSADNLFADADDLITYTVDVRHSGTSSASAFEVATVDQIPAGLIYVPGSLATVPTFTVPTSLTIVGSAITATWDSLTLAPAQVGRFTYQARLAPTATAPSSMTNTATTTWTSVPLTAATTTNSTSDTERFSGGTALDNYVHADAVIVAVADPAIDKALTATSDASTAGNSVTIGETATYELRVTLPEATIANFKVTDIVPAGMRYVTGSATLDTTGFIGTFGANTFTVTTAGTTDTLTLDVTGSSVVTADNDVTNNSFTITFQAVVADVAGNTGYVPQTTVANTASVQLAAGPVVTSNTVAATVVEPRLVLVKTFAPNAATPGSTVTVEITVQNTGTSNGFDEILTDALDPRFDAATVVPTVVPAGWTFGQAGAALTWTQDSSDAHAAGATLTFRFDVQVRASNVANDTIPNQASATTTTRDAVGPGEFERTEAPATGNAVLGIITPDLNVAKSDGVLTAAPGDTLNYTVTVNNTGGATATNVVLVDTIPTGTSYVSGSDMCATGTSAGQTHTYDLGTIIAGANATCVITVTVDYPAAAGTTTYVNNAGVQDDATHGADPTPANNVTSDTDLIAANPDIVAFKDDGFTTRTPGALTDYTVIVANTGSIGATNVLIQDTLPDGFVFSGCTLDAGTFSGPCAMSGGVVTATASIIPGAGGSVQLTISGSIVNPAPTGLVTVMNTVTAIDDGANGIEPTPANNTATDVDTIDAAPDLVVTKVAASPSAAPGSTVDYTITVANVGTQDAANVPIVDTFPVGLTPICGSAVPTAFVCTTTSIEWTVAGFAAGDTHTFTYTATLDDPLPAGTDTLTNTVTASDGGGDGPDPTPENNTADATLDVTGAFVDVSITKTDNTPTATPGDLLTYEIVVTNDGNIGANDVTVTDLIPVGTTFVAAPGAMVAAGRAIWDIGTLAGGGATVTMSITVTVDDPATAGRDILLNTVFVTEDGTNGDDPDFDDNITIDIDTLDATPDITVTKDDGLTAVSPGDTITYTVNVANVGTQAATGVELTDTLPAGTTFVSASDGGSELAGTVTFPLFPMTGHTSRDFFVTVTVDAPVLAGIDTITNVASAFDDTTNGTDPTPANNVDFDTDTVVAVPDLSITKSDGATTITAGATVTYSVVVANNGDQEASGVVVTDTIPAGTTFVSAADTGYGPGVHNTGEVTWTIGSIPGGELRTLSINVEVDTPATAGRDDISNIVSVTDDGTNGTDPTPADNIATDVNTLDATPDLTVTKTDGFTSVAAGDTVIYDIDVANVGSQDATGVVVTDMLPAGTTFVTASDAGTNIAGIVTWPAFDIAGGDTVTLSVSVTIINPVVAARETVTNTATATDDGTNGADPTPANNTGADTDDLDAAPDLTITKSDGVATVAPGDSTTYTMTITNVGDQDGSGVVITDLVPAGTTFVSASDGGTELAGTVTWLIGHAGAGAAPISRTMTVTVDNPVTAGRSSIINTATVTDDGDGGTDPTPDNNTGTDIDVLAAAPDLTIVKDDGLLVTTPGSTLTYTLTVANVGDQDATGVQITDSVPDGTTFGSASLNGVDAADETFGVVTWPDFTLDAGDTVVVTVTVIVDSTATAGRDEIVNTATVADDGAGGTDPTPENNTDTDTDILTATPDLVVTKTDGEFGVRPGDTLTYTITVANVGDEDATGVVITDTLPNGTTFVAADGSGTHDNGTVIWPTATVASGAARSLTVTVTVVSPFNLDPLELTNVASAFDDGSGGADPTPENNTGEDTDTVDNTLDMTIVKSNGTDVSTPGTYTTWELTITNNGPVAVDHFTVRDALPAQITDVSYQTSAGTYDPASGHWDGPAVAAGSTVTVSVTGLIASNATGTLTNTATVTPSDGLIDLTPDNNTDTDTDTLMPVSALSITKTAADTTVTVGDDMLYTINVTNNGPSVAYDVVVTDVMPAGIRFNSVASGAGGTCISAGTTSVSCTLAEALPASGVASFQISTTTTSTGDIRNVATVVASSAGIVVSESAVADIAVSAAAPLVPSNDPLPHTGAEALRALIVALLLLGLGVLFRSAARHRCTT